MALATYADLQASIASWLARDDLTANIPDFITLFESKAARKLRVRTMEYTEILQPDNGCVSLPTDYLGHRSLRRTDCVGGPLVYVHPSMLRGLYPASQEGEACHYTIEGGNIILRPACDAELEFVYIAKNDALSDKLNWLYENHPDIYLFGSLAEAHGFNIDAASMQLWASKRDEVFDEIALMDFRERADMTVRVAGPTP